MKSGKSWAALSRIYLLLCKRCSCKIQIFLDLSGVSFLNFSDISYMEKQKKLTCSEFETCMASKLT